MKVTDRVSTIKGIGEKTEQLLKKLSIETVDELIHYYPREYETYALPTPISLLREGNTFTIEASVLKSVEVTRMRNLQLLTCMVTDPTGTLKLVWYNQPYMKNMMKTGTRHILRGRVSRRKGVLCMEQPKLYKREEYRNLLQVMQPVYGLTEGLHNSTVLKAVKDALGSVDGIEEKLPAELVKKHGLMKHKNALLEIHFPKSSETLADARRRLVFEEFFGFMLRLSQSKDQNARENNHFRITDFTVWDVFLKKLPYTLTNAQLRTLQEIKTDLSGDHCMSRLIQGDVGSGKTILALLSCMAVIKAGHQAAIMVPTEVLARQHMAEACRLLSGYAECLLLTGSMTAAAKKAARGKIESGEANLIIGTHALFQEKVKYNDLALVVTDEQHRFGVRERQGLSEKGEHPHILVMSATPIPRTLAIILYGDLFVSLVDELPKGRKPIKNCVVGTGYRETAYRFIRKQVEAGHQAMIICALVEDSEHTEAENVIDYSAEVKEALGSDIKVEYLHGRMPAREKTDRMNRFAEGEIKVLVSTTVIEVGINVPNATVMMIENAERFGLAQLHQLRGRVGRGESESYCILVSSNESEETMKRLNILKQSNDGFYIAGEDLKLRGPGDLFGIRQSGDLSFSLGDIYTDSAMLKEVSEAVTALTEQQKKEYSVLWLSKNGEEALTGMAESI